MFSTVPLSCTQGSSWDSDYLRVIRNTNQPSKWMISDEAIRPNRCRGCRHSQQPHAPGSSTLMPRLLSLESTYLYQQGVAPEAARPLPYSSVAMSSCNVLHVDTCYPFTAFRPSCSRIKHMHSLLRCVFVLVRSSVFSSLTQPVFLHFTPISIDPTPFSLLLPILKQSSGSSSNYLLLCLQNILTLFLLPHFIPYSTSIRFRPSSTYTFLIQCLLNWWI